MSSVATEKKKMTNLLARCHLLDLRRGKNKEMTTSQGGLLSSVTFLKNNKQMRMSLLASHHLLHLREKKKKKKMNKSEKEAKKRKF